MNLTNQQWNLLRQLVTNDELYGGKPFYFTWSKPNVGGLSYTPTARFRPEGDETDLDRLRREDLVDIDRIGDHGYRGKPTQLGITAVHDGFADERSQPRRNLDPKDGQTHPPIGPNAGGCGMPEVNRQASPELTLGPKREKGSQATAAEPEELGQQQPESVGRDKRPAKVYKTVTGRNIDRLRKECGWSFNVLAAQTGLDKTLTLGHVNEGKGAHPSTLKIYADAFAKRLNRPVTVAELEG